MYACDHCPLRCHPCSKLIKMSTDHIVIDEGVTIAVGMCVIIGATSS